MTSIGHRKKSLDLSNDMCGLASLLVIINPLICMTVVLMYGGPGPVHNRNSFHANDVLYGLQKKSF
jgi:hypothetical protein